MFLIPYGLSVISAGLLILSFEPFDLWLLAFIGLIPYFYALNFKKDLSKADVFGYGFVLGILFSCGLSYQALQQFHWYSSAGLFSFFMNAMWIPISIISGALGGAVSLIYKRLQRGDVFDVFVFASAWTVVEWLRQIIFLSFDYGPLAYAGYRIIPLISFASIGGIFLVSFLIASLNGFLGWFLKYRFDKKSLAVFAGFVLASLAVYYSNQFYLGAFNKPSGREVVFSTIQINEKKNPFGKFENGNFSLNKGTYSLIKGAVSTNPDYLIYPFGLTGGLLVLGKTDARGYLDSATFEEMGKWLKSEIPEKTVFLMWTNSVRNNEADGEINFWKNGEVIGYYRKRDLFAFIDYTPMFAQNFGFYTTPIDYVPAKSGLPVRIGNDIFGNLICSELNLSSMARKDSKEADIILAIGSDAVFKDSLMGDRSLIVAQYRAVETNRPVVRADRKGPSAFIDKSGRIVSGLSFDIDGVLTQKVFIEDSPKQTIYSRFGDAPFIVILLVFLLYPVLLNFSFVKKLSLRLGAGRKN